MGHVQKRRGPGKRTAPPAVYTDTFRFLLTPEQKEYILDHGGGEFLRRLADADKQATLARYVGGPYDGVEEAMTVPPRPISYIPVAHPPENPEDEPTYTHHYYKLSWTGEAGAPEYVYLPDGLPKP